LVIIRLAAALLCWYAYWLETELLAVIKFPPQSGGFKRWCCHSLSLC